MVKIYKTWEMIKALEEDNTLEFKKNNNQHDTVVGSSYLKYLELKQTNFLNKSLDGNISLDDTWTLIDTSMTFDEAVRSGKKLRVKHSSIPLNTSLWCNDDVLVNHWHNYQQGEYLYLNSLLLVLSWKLSADDLADIIKYGKWYIKEDK